MEVSDEVLKGLDISKNLDDKLFERLLVEAFHSLSNSSKEANYELITSMLCNEFSSLTLRFW
jgi:hypothetical protein